MPTCQNCHEKWSWKQTIKKSLTLLVGMTCPYCSERQYQTARMRRRTTLIPIIIVPFIMIGHHFFGFSPLYMLFLFGILLLGIAINPFFIELASEEESLL